MQRRSHSLSDHSTFHFALIAFVCVVLGLLTGISPAGLAGADGPTRQIDPRVAQLEATSHAALPMDCLDTPLAAVPPEELVELSEPTDDEADEDETKHYVPRSDLAAFSSPSPAGLHESSADGALTPFRLLAFSTRGSPLA